MSLEHMQAYVITKRSSNFNYNLRVDVQIPALNINHPAGHLLPRPVHHDHYHVHYRNILFFVLCLVLFLGEWVAEHITGCAVQLSCKWWQIQLVFLHASYSAQQWQLIALIRSARPDAKTSYPVFDLPAISWDGNVWRTQLPGCRPQ